MHIFTLYFFYFTYIKKLNHLMYLTYTNYAILWSERKMRCGLKNALQFFFWKFFCLFVYSCLEFKGYQTSFCWSYTLNSFVAVSSIFTNWATVYSSISVRLAEQCVEETIFKSCHWCSIIFRSRLCRGHSNISICCDINPLIVALWVYLCSVCCCRKALLMLAVRREWADWFNMIGRQQ